MLAATNSLGLSELQAYERIDGPIGPERGDRRAHAIALAVCGGKGADVMRLLEFGTPEELTPEELTPEEKTARNEALLRKFKRIMGGSPDGDGR